MVQKEPASEDSTSIKLTLMAKSNDKIGPYTLINKLGRGAFSIVWLAEARSLIIPE